MNAVDPAQTPTLTDEEIAAIAPTIMVRIAAGLQVGSGLVSALVGLQTLLSIHFIGLLFVLPTLLCILGVAAMPLGSQVYRTREWAARAGFALSGVLALVQLIWLVLGMSLGLVSCLGIMAAPLAMLAFPLAYFAIAPCKRSSAIRQRMEAAGLELGI